MPRTKRSRVPKKQMRRRRARKPRTEYAAMRETYEFATLFSGQAYTDTQVSLARFLRATSIAKGYQQYRISKVEYQFKPLVDTFASDNTSLGGGIPYLLTVVDKTGEFSAFQNSQQLREAGAKPRRLDDKTLRVTYKPAVLDYVYDRNNSSNSWAKPIISPWLSTNKNNDGSSTVWNPSSIDHLGLAWIVEGGTNQTAYQLEVTAYFEFRRPLFLVSSTSEGMATQAPPKRKDVENQPPEVVPV